MALQPVDQNKYGVSLTTTFLFDLDELQDLKLDPEFKEVLVRLYLNLNRTLLAINAKQNGFFPLNQTLSGQNFFPNPNDSYLQPLEYRQVFRVVINFGQLPNAGSKSVPHNIAINAGVTFTHIYATASDPVGFNYLPIPYANNSSATGQIQIDVNATNVTINTGTINRSNFTICYVVLEFLKY